MTDVEGKRIEEFHDRLTQMLDELVSHRASSITNRAAVQLDQQSVGRLSRMDALQAQQVALAADRQRQARISRIRYALQRIDAGEFGYCVECGSDIAEGRLDADPSVTLCVVCAGQRAH